MIVNDQLKEDGLGNHLFRIAATLAHAARMDTSAIFNKWQYSDYFERQICNSETMSNAIHDSLTEYKENQKLPFQPINRKNNLILHGYFQSDKYFVGLVDYVLGHFKLKHEFFRTVRDAGSEILNLNNITAIHVRRGDYLRLSHIFNILTPENYYDGAMDLMEQKLNLQRGKGNFVFFSDDIPWCQRTFGKSYHYSTGSSDIVDMFMMAMCKHHIIANSSYSWWGAYLKRLFFTETERANLITIAPDKWFNPVSGIYQEDVYVDGWIRL